MKSGAFFLDRPVYSLQTMLRRISTVNPEVRSVIPSGIYDSSTEASVKSFQSCFQLPVTGETDQKTWEKIVSEHRTAAVSQIRPKGPLHKNPSRPVKPGEKNRYVCLVQTMLTTLSDVYEGLEPLDATGRLNESTVNALQWLQRAADLPLTGNLDIFTWNYLNDLYWLTIGNGWDETSNG